MSYEIIKSIKIKDNKVLIKYASNNVSPKTFNECESISLTKILQEKGQEALDIEILQAYESGVFQRGNNKYCRALKVLRHFPEYKDFNWRNSTYEDNCPIQKNRKSETFIILLKKAMKTKLPKDNFIITKDNPKDIYGNKLYLWKITKRFARWSLDKTKAKIFRYKDDTELTKHCFTNSENWETEKIK